MDAVLYLGILIVFVGGIGLLIAAFKTSIWWGLGCLLLPIVPLIFLIEHWGVSKKLFLLQLIGFVLIIIGMYAQQPMSLGQVTI